MNFGWTSRKRGKGILDGGRVGVQLALYSKIDATTD